MTLQLDYLEIDLSLKKYYVTINGSRLVSPDLSSMARLLKEADFITKVKIIGYTSDRDLFTSVVNLISPKSAEVDLSSNLLEKDGITIAKLLGSSTKINKVDLSNNALKEDGSKVIAALASESIVNISIADNWMESCDARIFKTYMSFTSLHRIDLSGNDLDGLIGVGSDVLEIVL